MVGRSGGKPFHREAAEHTFWSAALDVPGFVVAGVWEPEPRFGAVRTGAGLSGVRGWIADAGRVCSIYLSAADFLDIPDGDFIAVGTAARDADPSSTSLGRMDLESVDSARP